MFISSFLFKSQLNYQISPLCHIKIDKKPDKRRKKCDQQYKIHGGQMNAAQPKDKSRLSIKSEQNINKDNIYLHSHFLRNAKIPTLLRCQLSLLLHEPSVQSQSTSFCLSLNLSQFLVILFGSLSTDPHTVKYKNAIIKILVLRFTENEFILKTVQYVFRMENQEKNQQFIVLQLQIKTWQTAGTPISSTVPTVLQLAYPLFFGNNPTAADIKERLGKATMKRHMLLQIS